VLEAWSKETLNGQNALTYLGNHLGYRLSLSSAMLPERLSKGGTLKLRLTLSNLGFSAVSNPCELTLVLKDGSLSYVYPLDCPDLTALEAGKTLSIRAKINLPHTLQSESLRLGLRIEMAGGAQKGDVNRCIELATNQVTYEDCFNYFASYTPTDGKYRLDG
jgi:hypothetical protein